MFVYCEFSRQGQWTWRAWNLIYLTPTWPVFPLEQITSFGWYYMSHLCINQKNWLVCWAQRWEFRGMLFKCFHACSQLERARHARFSSMYSRASVCNFLVRETTVWGFHYSRAGIQGEAAVELADLSVLNVLSCCMPIGSRRLLSRRLN